MAPGTGGGAGAGTVAVILKTPIGHGGGSLNFLDLTLSGVTFTTSRYDVHNKKGWGFPEGDIRMAVVYV